MFANLGCLVWSVLGAQGSVGGAPAVVKVFDPRFPGSEEAMQHEWRVYEHLGRQGAHGC